MIDLNDKVPNTTQETTSKDWDREGLLNSVQALGCRKAGRMSPQPLAHQTRSQGEHMPSMTEWCLADTDLAPLKPIDLLHVASFYSTSHRPGDRLYLGILRDGLFFIRRDTDTGAETIVSHSRENLERFTLTAEERVRLGVEG